MAAEYKIIYHPTLNSYQIHRISDGIHHANGYRHIWDAMDALGKINSGLIRFQPFVPHRSVVRAST